MGLNDKLRQAPSAKAVDILLAEGKVFSYASSKTQRRWKYVSDRRLKELRLLQESAAVSEKKAEKADKPTKAKKQKT